METRSRNEDDKLSTEPGQLQMAIVASDHWRGSGHFWVTQQKTRRRLKVFAGLYFTVMLLRLLITVAIPPHTLLERGLIPVIAHWDLAAFIYLTARTPKNYRDSSAFSALTLS